MKGLIFSVKRYSIHDGPGIRLTFFMKGCPLACRWCHNPEGRSPDPETVERINRVGDKEFKSFEQAGKYYSVNDILEIIKKEKIFISESGGGVTFSGGEPMLQTEFLVGALKACKAEGYRTAVDTCGYSQPENYRAIFPYTDLFLYDIKIQDDVKHRIYTGVSNSLIMSNFKLILDSGKDIMVRVPVVPGYNDDRTDLEEIRNLLTGSKRENLKKICLLPYHKTGISKYRKFSVPYRMNDVKPPSRERMNELKAFFEETGIKVKIGG